MSAIHSCPHCPQAIKAPSLPDLARAVEVHRQLVHGSLTRHDTGSRRR